MRKRMNKENNAFIILSLISVLIIIGVFSVSINNPTGHATSERKVSAWHCGFYSSPPYNLKGSWIWVSWPDAETRLSKVIHAKDANCVKGEWVCPYSVCGDGKDVKDCYCIE